MQYTNGLIINYVLHTADIIVCGSVEYLHRLIERTMTCRNPMCADEGDMGDYLKLFYDSIILMFTFFCNYFYFNK